MSKKRSSVADNNPLEIDMRPKLSKRGRRSKPLLRDNLKRTSMFLHKDQLDWLYDICKIDARKDGGAEVSKTYVVRALIDTAKEYGLDLKGVRNEEDVYARVEEFFRKHT